jgi:3-oxoacyl-[acyl-carrier-protein] synthase-3
LRIYINFARFLDKIRRTTKMQITSKISGTGSYVPTVVVDNSDFLHHTFYDEQKQRLPQDNEEIIRKFYEITGIESRRYAAEDMCNSDMGTIAAQRALEDAGIDGEEIDQIIVAHNFGDVSKYNQQSNILPSISARIKHNLKIKNPSCVAYDIIFGCPGWIQGIIQADAYIKSGQAKHCLVIGTETLSRVIDPHDRDSMIYSDGAGACIVSKKEEADDSGVLSYAAESYTYNEAYYLRYGASYGPEADNILLNIKMDGRKIYEFALSHVPLAMKEALEKSGRDIHEVKKILIHQANEKMDDAIIKRFFKLYGIRKTPDNMVPMSINELGNSSVATIPTLWDLIRKENYKGHTIKKGDVLLFASVGSGMNINSFVYKV